MLQVDEVIENSGGWPGAFSQNHPSPDPATLAAEQMVQKNELKAQKKAAASEKKGVASGSGLFDFGDDLDELARASGAPSRPKARATPAKAAGGKASKTATRSDDVTDWQAMCAIRTVLAREGSLPRLDLIRLTARDLGFARSSPRIAKELEGAIRRASRRAIARNESGTLTLETRKIEDYDRAFLKQHLLGCVTAKWCDKSEVLLRFARTLGFSRVGPRINETVWSLMRALLRAGLIETTGAKDQKQYRKSKG